MLRALIAIVFSAALPGVLAGCGAGADATLTPATVDLQRYLGRWYVIARTEPGDGVGTWREYRARPDGRIDALEFWRDRTFVGEVHRLERIAQADPAAPALWRVRTGWLSAEEEHIVYVSADYRHAIVGDAARRKGWLLAREPEIAEWSYAGLVARLALLGYDVSRIRRVPQKLEQVGQPGYE